MEDMHDGNSEESEEETSSDAMEEDEEPDDPDDEDSDDDDDDDESMEEIDDHGQLILFYEWVPMALQAIDGVLPEVSRNQWNEWLDAAREHLSVPDFDADDDEINDDFRYDLNIGVCQFICLATETNTRQRFSVLADLDKHLSIKVDLEGLEQALLSLPLSGIPIPRDVLDAGTSALADVFGRLRQVDGLTFRPCESFTFPFILPILGACRRLANIDMEFGDTNTDAFLAYLPALTACLDHHPSLESARFQNISSQLLQMLSTALPTIPTFHECWLQGEGCVISSISDAEALARIFAMEQLGLRLVKFAFSGDPYVTQTICNGLRNSKLTELSFVGLSIPQCMRTAVASAITEMPELTDFTFIGEVDQSFWSALGQGWKDSHNLERLELERNDYLSSDDVAAFFRTASLKGLRCLILRLKDWTPAFDTIFSAFVSRHPLWETLHINLSYDEFVGPSVVSAALLAAVDSPECCLNRVEFGSSQHVDATWKHQFYYILDLNRQRRRHNSSFESVRNGLVDLMDAVADIDDDFLFEFLRRNEWDLQTRLRNYMP